MTENRSWTLVGEVSLKNSLFIYRTFLLFLAGLFPLLGFVSTYGKHYPYMYSMTILVPVMWLIPILIVISAAYSRCRINEKGFRVTRNHEIVIRFKVYLIALLIPLVALSAVGISETVLFTTETNKDLSALVLLVSLIIGFIANTNLVTRLLLHNASCKPRDCNRGHGEKRGPGTRLLH